MLAILPSESIHLKHHMETLIMYNTTQFTPVSVEPISDMAKVVPSGGKKKKFDKRKTSP